MSSSGGSSGGLVKSGVNTLNAPGGELDFINAGNPEPTAGKFRLRQNTGRPANDEDGLYLLWQQLADAGGLGGGIICVEYNAQDGTADIFSTGGYVGNFFERDDVNTAYGYTEWGMEAGGDLSAVQALIVRQSGDNFYRWSVFYDGNNTWSDGNGTVLANLYSDTLDLLETDNRFGSKGLLVKEGANARQGVVALVGGTAVVANASVTATSRIQLTAQALGTVAVPSALAVSARVAGTSFTILASAPTDTSTVAYEIFEPAP